MDLPSKNRLADLGAGTGLGMGDQTQNFNLSSSVSPPFASTWGTQKIWNAPIGTGMKTATHDSTRPNVKSAPLSRMSFSPDAQRGGDIPSLGDSEAITGSGSLLAESEGWNPGLSSQWGISTTLGSNRAAHTSTSPVRQRTNQHTRSNSPYFTTTPTAIGPGSANKSAFQSHLNPQSQVFSSTRQNSDESERRNLSSISFGSMATNGAPPFSGYNSSAASRSGSLPPSRHGHEQSQQQAQDFTANSLHVSSSEIFTHRPNQHSRNSIYSTNGNTRYGEQGWPFEVTNGFGKMDLGKETQENGFSGYWDQSHQLPSPTSSNGQVNGFRSNSISFDMENRLAQPFISHNVATRGPFNERNTYSPTGSEARRSHDSPMGYSSGAPSITEHSRAMSTASSRNNLNGHPDFLHTKLRDLEHQQAYGQNQQNSLFSYRAPFNFSGQPFDLNMALVNMNHQIPSYYTNPQLARYPQPNRLPPRGPAVDNSNDDSLRSSLLTEFRTCKQTKRYELKDIYNHVVEFSGDQHGSRFIQQKLENANSDEKAQLFSEILPNALQLMTDVFGNYVIQKFFEHGNQTQKKQLADKMKGQIGELSMQMYGCRVVQKAFEHILIDQQAALVRELEHQVLKCVKDQNGNHVVQKAIQRIPAEHIPFIINAFAGQVHTLATHPYGCRVVQRMLEYCQDEARTNLLSELHACAQNLIIDQYGNYVIQHVIQHGNEEDKIKLDNLIASQIVFYSKHKFASNVVEKSIEFGNDEDRRRIVSLLSSVDSKGEAPLLSLMRDQFGNYVIQKLIKQLKSPEIEEFITALDPQLVRVKTLPFNKHISQIQKEIEKRLGSSPVMSVQPALGSRQPPPIDISAAPTPPLLSEDTQSPQSSSQPSTTNSTVDGPIGERKEKESPGLRVEGDDDTIIAATSATPKATEAN